jgi:hypothetical protein
VVIRRFEGMIAELPTLRNSLYIMLHVKATLCDDIHDRTDIIAEKHTGERSLSRTVWRFSVVRCGKDGHVISAVK